MKRPPLLLLYGIDEHTLPIDVADTHRATRRAAEALEQRGWQVALSQVQTNVGAALTPFEPGEWLVFNWCEGSPDQAFYYARAAQELEQQGYAFTGSTASVLHRTQSKVSTKRLLEAPGCLRRVGRRFPRRKRCTSRLFPRSSSRRTSTALSASRRDGSVVTTLARSPAQAQAVLERFGGRAIIEEFLDSAKGHGIALLGTPSRLEVLGMSVIRYDGFPECGTGSARLTPSGCPVRRAYLKMPACPAPLEPEMAAELAGLARRAHRVCGLRDYSRIDVRLRTDGPWRWM